MVNKDEYIRKYIEDTDIETRRVCVHFVIAYYYYPQCGSVLETTTRRRNSLFGHLAGLAEDTPAHQALWCHVDLSLGRPEGWRRCPGRPRNRWLDQLRKDNNTPPTDLWR